MNGITRGIKNTLRTPLRSVAIVIMIAISVGLVLSMLAARGGISTKISSVEASTANQITINPAGMQGGFGNASNPLTTANLTTIAKTAHVASADATLTDRLTNQNDASSTSSSDDSKRPDQSSGGTTSLTPSQTLGAFGARQMGQSGSSSGNAGGFGGGNFTPVARITVTGTNNPSATITSSQIKSGSSFDGASSDNVAMVGASLASKNNLKVGSTFTAYDKTITVAALYSTGNEFQDNGLIMPLKTVQALSGQANDIAAITATVDSSSNVQTVASSLKKSLGSSADITSDADQAASLVQPLKSIASLALAGVIAATIAGAVIVLLAMTIIVRERRREVGVMKAIGAGNGTIIRQFSVEALTLTIIGGIIGIGLGLAVAGPITASLASSASSSSNSSSEQPSTPIGGGFSRGAIGRPAGGVRGFGRNVTNQISANFGHITTDISPSVFGLSILLLLVIAVVGSVIPALLITNVKPAEILRNE